MGGEPSSILGAALSSICSTSKSLQAVGLDVKQRHPVCPTITERNPKLKQAHSNDYAKQEIKHQPEVGNDKGKSS